MTRAVDRDGPARPALVVAVLSSVGLIASLCMTLVVPIVPQLPALLHTTTADASEPTPDDAGPVVHGRVRTAHGAPAPDARVTLVDLHGRQLAVVPGDPDGTFRAPVDDPGTVLVIASGPGGGPTAGHVSLAQRAAPRDLVLAR